jgi:hypothetical protein
MTAHSVSFEAALPAPLPTDEASRLLLFAIRRMAVAGLDDAHAQHAFFSRFGLRYRRPLVLLRALMLELSRCAQQAIHVAPPCCPRMTQGEITLIDVVCSSTSDPRNAHAALCHVAGTSHSLGPLTSAQAVHEAFLDAGLPFAGA